MSNTFRCVECGRERDMSRCVETDSNGYLYCDACVEVEEEGWVDGDYDDCYDD